MTAILFALTELETGRLRGQAIVCAEARYAAIRWAGADHVERRYGLPRQWLSAWDELEQGLPPGPLPEESVSRRLLAVDSDVAVQYVSHEPVTVDPADIAPALDARLVGA